jgi:hypothetical protein
MMAVVSSPPHPHVDRRNDDELGSASNLMETCINSQDPELCSSQMANK